MSGGFESRVALRPRSLDEVVDLAFAYARHSPRLILRWMAMHGAAAAAVAALLHYGLGWGWHAVWGIGMVAGAVLESIQLWALGAHLFGRTPSLRTACLSLRRIGWLVVLLAGVLTLPVQLYALSDGDGGMVAVAITLGLFWSLLIASQYHLPAVIVLEKVPWSRALRRAWLLGSFGYGHALSLVLLGAMMRVTAVATVETFVQVTTTFMLQFEAPFENLWLEGGSTASIAAYMAFGPFMALVYLLAYVDARTRTEGWDLQVRFNELAERRRQEDGRRAA